MSTDTMSTMCLHCQKRIASPCCRGLCQTCGRDKSILELFPDRRRSLKPGDKRLRGTTAEVTEASAPTFTPAWSEARILVMRARAAAGMSVFHPDDFQLSLE